MRTSSTNGMRLTGWWPSTTLDTGDRTEFAYDGLGRRVKITEYGPAVTAEVQPKAGGYVVL